MSQHNGREMRRLRQCLAALVATCAVLVAGCARNGNTGNEPGKLTVLCGGSFRPPMEALVRAFEEQTGIPVELSFGQSEDLLPVVKLRKEGDVFVSHDPYLDYVDEAGSLLGAAQVGYVAPVVVVAKGNPAGVESLDDLAKPGVKVALPDPEFSTCGQMLFKLLEKKGIKGDVSANAEGAIFRSHSEIGTALKLRQREAGVMWNGVAHTFRDSLEVVPTPYEYEDTIRVWVIGLNYSEHGAGVNQLLDFVRKQGTGVFAKYGYVK
jgi:molybdate transport system substrate-binding protein